MWTRAGRRREMGLGAANKQGVSLAKARAAATRAREALLDGLDPIEAREAAKQQPKPCPHLGRWQADVATASLAPAGAEDIAALSSEVVGQPRIAGAVGPAATGGPVRG